jgi:hypothetical protein
MTETSSEPQQRPLFDPLDPKLIDAVTLAHYGRLRGYIDADFMNLMLDEAYRRYGAKPGA